MPYNTVIDRTDVPVREVTLDEATDHLETQSAVLQMFRRIPLSKKAARFRVLSALPIAYWVNGDVGLKQTTEMAWGSKFIDTEELAVIVPIPQNVVDDSDYDIFAEARPRITEAIGRALDSAVFFGINAPASFPTNVRAACLAAGNGVVNDPAVYTTAQGGFFGALDDLQAKVEDDGYAADGFVMSRSTKGLFRRARNTTGERIDRDRINAQFSELDGLPVSYAMDGLWPAKSTGVKGALGFAGDFRRSFVVGVRKDVSFEVFREGVIQDNTGTIVYNLMQQDMIALRVTFRAGWQVANLMTYANLNEATRYPAAVLETVVG